jgi:hypothetical protein
MINNDGRLGSGGLVGRGLMKGGAVMAGIGYSSRNFEGLQA